MGIKIEVNIPPKTNSKSIFGIVFAKLYESDRFPIPRLKAKTIMAIKPVKRLTAVNSEIVAVDFVNETFSFMKNPFNVVAVSSFPA